MQFIFTSFFKKSGPISFAIVMKFRGGRFVRKAYICIFSGIFLTAGCGDKDSSDRSRIAGISYPADVPYELVVARENGDGGQISEDEEGLRLTEDLCQSRGRFSSYEFIETVTVDGFTDKTGADGGYLSNTNLIRVKPGTYKVSLTPGYKFGSYSENWRVWVDLDGNGKFDPAEKLLETSGIGTLTKELTIPTTAVRGKTKMRVSMRWGGFPSACGTFVFGEVQDYDIEITDKPWTNPVNKLDVNKDFCLTSSDLLAVARGLSEKKPGPLPGLMPPGESFIDVNGSNSITALDTAVVMNAQGRGELNGCFERPGELTLKLPTLSRTQIAAGESFAIKWGADDCSPKMRASEEAKKTNPNALGFFCSLPGSVAPFDLLIDKNEKTATYPTQGATDFNVVVHLTKPYVPANPNEVCVEGCLGEIIATARLKVNLKAGEFATHQLRWETAK